MAETKSSCLFCDISAKRIPSETLYEDDDLIVFKDIKPIADTHLLLVPRKHYKDLNGLTQSDEPLYGKIVRVAADMAKKEDIQGGWQLFVRVGKGGGQEVPHVHFHLISGSRC